MAKGQKISELPKASAKDIQWAHIPSAIHGKNMRIDLDDLSEEVIKRISLRKFLAHWLWRNVFPILKRCLYIVAGEWD